MTNMVSNLHAGKDFYLDSLKSNYHLSFSDDFASVMEEIEREYKEKNKLTDTENTLLVRNWQDILAVYIYEKSKAGATSFTLDASCKDDLARIFEEMNPIVRDKQDITKISYGNRKINYYIKKNNIAKKDRSVLKKYVETDCKLLCAVVTASKGFVRESVGDNVSEDRRCYHRSVFTGWQGRIFRGRQIYGDRRRSGWGKPEVWYQQIAAEARYAPCMV